jgi:hypothetical protein
MLAPGSDVRALAAPKKHPLPGVHEMQSGSRESMPARYAMQSAAPYFESRESPEARDEMQTGARESPRTGPKLPMLHLYRIYTDTATH